MAALSGVAKRQRDPGPSPHQLLVLLPWLLVNDVRFRRFLLYYCQASQAHPLTHLSFFSIDPGWAEQRWIALPTNVNLARQRDRRG
jgi:hypothetical protein